MEIKDMAEILLKGGKMLGKSCPECNAPLFQREGQVFCARCEWQEGRSTSTKAKKPAASSPEGSAGKDQEVEAPRSIAMDKPASEALQKAETAVLRRIHEYAGKLEDGSEDANLASNLEVMGELLELLEGILELKSREKADA
jgi:uncharacterized Zn finger protein (UPF0148 family)